MERWRPDRHCEPVSRDNKYCDWAHVGAIEALLQLSRCFINHLTCFFEIGQSGLQDG